MPVAAPAFPGTTRPPQDRETGLMTPVALPFAAKEAQNRG